MNPFFTPKWVTIYVIVLITIGTFVDRTYEGTMLLASLMICTWLAISLHELGHFLFGKWCGYDFIFLAFGPVLIEKESAGVRVKENRNWLFFGGVAMMTPPQEKRESLMKKMALYTAGGPFISLLLALFGLGLYELFSYQMLFYFALMNGTILMATMLPLKGSMKTDGYVLFTLMKNNDQSRLLMEDLLVSKELLSSKHPSQYSCEYIQLAKEKPPTVDNLQYAMLIYYHEIEKNGLLAAVNALKEYSAIPVTSKNKVQIGFLIHMKQLAHFLTGDAEIEKMEKYQQLLGKMEPVSYYRGKAIIAHMEGDKQTSKENIKKVSKIISQNEKMYGFLTAEKTLTRLVKNKIGD